MFGPQALWKKSDQSVPQTPRHETWGQTVRCPRLRVTEDAVMGQRVPRAWKPPAAEGQSCLWTNSHLHDPGRDQHANGFSLRWEVRQTGAERGDRHLLMKGLACLRGARIYPENSRTLTLK